MLTPGATFTGPYAPVLTRIHRLFFLPCRSTRDIAHTGQAALRTDL